MQHRPPRAPSSRRAFAIYWNAVVARIRDFGPLPGPDDRFSVLFLPIDRHGYAVSEYELCPGGDVPGVATYGGLL